MVAPFLSAESAQLCTEAKVGYADLAGNARLSFEWTNELSADAATIHGEWLHTPGNLTLSAYNQELWNNRFAEKRILYAQSNIVMNRKLSDFTKWGSEEIKSRGNVLSEMAAKIWIGPAVPVAATDAGSDAGEGRGRRQSVLSVVIDWKHTGHILEKETICESASSATLAKVLSRLAQILGVQVLERCTQISSARGPLVSQDPSKDFLIQATGQTYQTSQSPELSGMCSPTTQRTRKSSC